MVKIITKKNEFAIKIENGRDIMFDVGNRHYTIVTWFGNGVSIGERGNSESSITTYPDADTLLKEFLVDGKPLGDLIDGVVITDYS